MASIVQQGASGTERLYTVRPRNTKAVTNKRGTPSSIKFNLPPDLASNTDKYKSNLTKHEANVFTKAIDLDGLGFINFIAQSTSYSIQEKSQVMHTFGGKEAVYFYGRAPVMVQLTGTIVDDLDNNQFAEFLTLYNKFARGTSAAKEYAYVTLSLNNAKFVGSFMNISIQQSSDRDTDITFSAQFLAKTFTIASSDVAFAGTDISRTNYVNVRDPDPTLTSKDIQEKVQQSLLDVILDIGTDLFGGPKATVDKDSPSVAESNQPYFTNIPNTFGSLPELEGLSGFSISDIVEFFDIVVDTVTGFITAAVDLLAAINNFAKAVISVIEAVEQAFDDILSLVESVVNAVFGVIDTLTDVWTKLVNFPKSISDKIGSFGKSGGTPLPIAGSDNISSARAVSLLSVSGNTGSARGTPEGTAAVLSVSNSKSQAALTTNSETAGLSLSNTTATLNLDGSRGDVSASLGLSNSTPSLIFGSDNSTDEPASTIDVTPILVIGG